MLVELKQIRFSPYSHDVNRDIFINPETVASVKDIGDNGACSNTEIQLIAPYDCHRFLYTEANVHEIVAILNAK